MTLDLATLRDQIRGCRLSTQESVASQVAIREQMEKLTAKGRENTVRELSFHEEMTNVSSQLEALQLAIASGSDWTSEQEEQKQMLMRERDYMFKKLESQNNQISILRNETSRILTLIHDSEARASKSDEEKQTIALKIAALHRQLAGISSEQQALAKSIGDVQTSIQQTKTDLAEKRALKKAADSNLSTLDANLAVSKAKMAEYLRDYDQLLQTLQDMTASLSRQKAQNKKTFDELTEKERQLQVRLKDIENLTRENLKLNELKELAKKKLLGTEDDKKELEERKASVLARTNEVRDIQIRAMQKEIESYSKIRSSLRSELGLVDKKFLNTDHVVTAMSDVIQVNLNACKNLTFEKTSLQKSIISEQQKIETIIEEKGKYGISTLFGLI